MIHGEPLISVVMPSSNQKTFIMAAVESVLSQNYTNLELIVADCGSIDGSIDWLAKKQAEDNRLRWFSESEVVPARVLNKALRQTRGTIIGWLNADDLYTVDSVELAVNAFLTNPHWLIVYGRGEQMDVAGNIINHCAMLLPENPLAEFANNCFICQPSVFFKRSLIVLLGSLDESLITAVDFDYWLKALRQLPDRIGFIDIVLAYSQLHNNCAAPNHCLVPSWAGRIFSQAISLGSFCHAAKLLRDMDYRAFAGPFDWIFSYPEATTHILRDNFTLFLDAAQYEPVPIEQRMQTEANLCEHRFYREHFGIRYFFNHHSPNQPQDYGYFLRAVQRFRGAMANPNPPLLVMISQESFQLSRYLPIMDALNNFGTGYSVLLLQLVVKPDIVTHNLMTSTCLIYHCDNFAVLEISVSCPSNGVEFVNEIDNQLLSEILKSFNVLRHPRQATVAVITDDSFDEASYLERYPDVITAIQQGRFASGRQHFELHGRKEGRH